MLGMGVNPNSLSSKAIPQSSKGSLQAQKSRQNMIGANSNAAVSASYAGPTGLSKRHAGGSNNGAGRSNNFSSAAAVHSSSSHQKDSAKIMSL